MPHTSSPAPRVRWHDRVEDAFERWGRFVCRRARLVTALCLLLAAGFAWQLPRLTFDVSDESFLHLDDPVWLTYETFKRQFGRDGGVLIAIQPDEVFDLAFLERLRAFHEDLEAHVPQLEEVTSLINVRNTYGRGNELVVEDLLEHWPQNAADLAALRERVFANPLYRNQLISDDGRLTTVLIKMDTYSSLGSVGEELTGFEEEGEAEFLTSQEEQGIVAAIWPVVRRHESADFKMYLTGGSLLEESLFAYMQRDIIVSVGLSVVLVAMLLLAFFRNVWGALLPLGVVLLALLCTAGSMAALGVPVTLPIQVLPTFLLAVGICGAVHLLVLFFRGLEGGRSRENAIAFALGHSGLAVVMAGLTTAGGLASFATSSLAPVGHFGVFGPLGVLFTLVFVLALLPALLAWLPLRSPRARERPAGPGPLDRILLGLGTAATRAPRTVVLSSAALLVVAALGAARLEFSHDPMSWLPGGSRFRVDTQLINRELGGASDLVVLLETPGVENGFHDPGLLAELDELRDYAAGLQHGEITVGNSLSIADVLKETHQALNENRGEYYTIPDDRQLIAQELLLFENSGSDDLEDVIDSQFSQASFTLMVPWVDAIHLVPLIDEVEARFKEAFGERVQVTMTGGDVVFSRIFAAVIYSMAESYALALLIVTPLMILLIGNLRGGLLSMIPNLAPILLILGFMGWGGYTLDFSTMMVGAIVLGIAVDDTIHFMHVFQRYYRESGDVEASVRQTLETTGRAILVTSIVLCIGCFSFTFATMQNIVNLGFLTCIAISAALLADILLAPALLTLVLGQRGDPQSATVPRRLAPVALRRARSRG